jgi:RNA polymerase sigma factor (sigma-70 family)
MNRNYKCHLPSYIQKYRSNKSLSFDPIYEWIKMDLEKIIQRNLARVNFFQYEDREETKSELMFHCIEVLMSHEKFLDLLSELEIHDEWKYYLFGIVKNQFYQIMNRSIKEYKKKSYLEDIHSESNSDSQKEIMDPSIGILEELIQREDLNQVITAMDQFPPLRKKIFHLILKGKSNSEISNLLRIDRSTVGSHIHRGKKKLFQLFKN